MTTVRILRREEREHAADVLARALYEDPFFKAILPDPGTRRPPLHRQISGALRYTLHHGLVEVTDDIGGVAVWLPPGKTSVTPLAMLGAGPITTWKMMSLSPSAARRALAFRRPIDELHQRSAPGPHWYLWILGVDPRHQRRGLGTALIRHRLSEIDETQAYLETARRTNVTFYERLGFETAGITKVPEMRVTFWGMLSPARQRVSR